MNTVNDTLKVIAMLKSEIKTIDWLIDQLSKIRNLNKEDKFLSKTEQIKLKEFRNFCVDALNKRQNKLKGLYNLKVEEVE